MTSRGDGCSIYVKHTFHSTSITHEALSLINESVWVISTLQHCVYRPPGQSKENDDKVSEALIRISQLPYKYKTIVDDFNFPDIYWPKLTGPLKTQSAVAAVEMGGWTQHVSQPTHNANILDLIFTTEDIILDTRILIR